jgi:glycosyltransferase involved in cell wall biosynthesis
MLTPSNAENPAASTLAFNPPVTMPLVTMIVLCYNQARFVVETLDSVKDQTYKHTELVIIDDCSSDDSVAVITRWLRENPDLRCTFIPHQKNQGICKSLNEALSITSGKYISIIASDDIWLPDKIERQVAIMESQRDSVGVLYSDALVIEENGQLLPKSYTETYLKLPEMPQGHVLDNLLQRNFVPGPTALIRRTCYDKVGFYDESLPWEDWDMWLRVASCYLFIYSKRLSAKYRIHPNSLTRSDPARMIQVTIQILTKQIRLGHLDGDHRSTAARTICAYRKELSAVHFELAATARRNGDRAATIKHLAGCVRSAKSRLPGRFVAWASLLGYGLFGLKRLRLWRRFNPESG